MQDYIEDLLSGPVEIPFEGWDPDAIEALMDEEDELDECGSF